MTLEQDRAVPVSKWPRDQQEQTLGGSEEVSVARARERGERVVAQRVAGGS